jgi:hypothetical protein
MRRPAGVAQLAERLICNQQVAGSTPVAGSIPLGFGRTTFLSHRISFNREDKSMKKITTIMMAIPLAMFSAGALAGDAAAGAAKAESCMDCHAGEDFAGMSAAEIADAIRAGLNGEVKHPPGLDEISADDADDVAAYFFAEAGGE